MWNVDDIQMAHGYIGGLD